MNVESILKWGLLAVAAIWAVRFVSSMMDTAMQPDAVGTVNAPLPNGVVWMRSGPVNTYDYKYHGGGRGDRGSGGRRYRGGGR